MSPIVCKILSQTLLKRNLIDVEFVANFLDQNKLEEENLMEKSTRAKKILSISHINVNPYKTKNKPLRCTTTVPQKRFVPFQIQLFFLALLRS